ncbi:MAG: MFS transporter [Bacteroidota bacterium]
MKSDNSNPYLIIFALWLMMFSASSQVIIISPILPNISAELGIAEARLSWLVTSYAILLGIFALIIGPISDKIGRRLVLMIGCSSLGVTLFLHGLADSFWSLLVVRSLSGAAAGMLSGAAVSYVGDYFPYERRGWANGWVMSGVAAGQILGIPMGKFLAGLFGFRLPFIMFGVTMAFAVVFIWRFVPQPNVVRNTDRLTIKRAITNYFTLLKETKIVASAAAYTLMFASIGLYLVFLPTWLEREVGLANNDIVLLFLMGGVLNVIMGPMAGRISDKTGRKPIIIYSCIGLAIVMAATTYFVNGRLLAFIFFGLAMLLISMRISPFQALITALVEADRRGSLMSLSISIGQTGMALGSAVAGLAYTQYGYLSNTIMGAISMLIMAAVVGLFIPEPTGQPKAAPSGDA